MYYAYDLIYYDYDDERTTHKESFCFLFVSFILSIYNTQLAKEYKKYPHSHALNLFSFLFNPTTIIIITIFSFHEREADKNYQLKTFFYVCSQLLVRKSVFTMHLSNSSFLSSISSYFIEILDIVFLFINLMTQSVVLAETFLCNSNFEVKRPKSLPRTQALYTYFQILWCF